ncbi:MAG TPA: SDR family oxidoreductase [Ohtaekwangia sp.]|uniref:SDR family oxidoreductase n=1 Tax=Ohtaekwangia sp. TaxID=2066019 RepID=UPI002F953744
MKTIFITGTSSGLGKAAVQLFHSNGWHVIATMRNVEKAKDFAGMERVTVLPLDITNEEQIKTTVAKAIGLGSIDIVLNNAAYGAIGPLEGMSQAQIAQVVDTNLLGAIRVTQAFIPHFRERKSGLFINVTSMAGFLTFPFASIYSAVKFGLQGWSEGMNYELAPFGIRIKTVAPGYIKTEFGSNTLIVPAEPYKPMMDRFLSVIADPALAQQGSTAEDIAAVVYEAATDGKDRVHYVAGKDAHMLHDRRLAIGAEAAIKEIAQQFLG